MQFGAVRFVYNYFLAEQQDWYEKKQLHLSFFDLCRELVELQRNETMNGCIRRMLSPCIKV